MKTQLAVIDKLKNKSRRPSAPRLAIAAFAVTIMVGSALLMLSAAMKGKGNLPFIDALFLSTSATCITGLSTIDTAERLTVFGQIIMIVLMQVGGLGFMTVTSSLYIMLGRRDTLKERITIQEELEQYNMDGLRGLIKRIIKLTFITESIGMLLLALGFSRTMDFGRALWFGLFHSVAAFCNAGFDIIPGGSSVTVFNNQPLILLTLAALNIVGGLGFLVINNAVTKKRWRFFKLNTKVVLIFTAVLLLFGTVAVFACEYNNSLTIGNMSAGQKLLNALFMSASSRTAGFNSISVKGMRDITKIIICGLMFVGGAPASTAGGIKITTLFILLAVVFSAVNQRKKTIIGMRKINENLVAKAVAVLMLALIVLFVGQVILSLSDGAFSLSDRLFEQISAYCTTGLTVGVSQGLSVVGKLVMIFSMFVGRIGILSFFTAFTAPAKHQSAITYEDANINI